MTGSNNRALRLIRHGESNANAGQATSDPYEIDLTALGRKQAADVALSFQEPPDLIIHSPMQRAAMTARPTIDRFPDVPVMELNIQEFTYLDPVRCQGTTAAGRKGWVESYWNTGDIESRDDGWNVLDALSGKQPRCESFLDFVMRVRWFVRLLTEYLEESQRIAVFGHGQHLLQTHIELMRITRCDGNTRVDDKYMGKRGYVEIESDMKAFPSRLKNMHLGNAESEYWALNGSRWVKSNGWYKSG
jgi:broad specificity phosphatase PhoE